MIVLLWSLSRSVILTWVVLYSVYFGFAMMGHLAQVLRGWITTRILTRVAIGGLVSLGIVSIIPYLADIIRVLLNLQAIEQRLGGESGLSSRVAAWKQLWPYFTDAPLTGKAGWWNSTNLLPETNASGVATSPHNLYLRLLSESGLAGFLSVLALPALSGLICLKRTIFSVVGDQRFKINSFILGSIVAIFTGQFFEDIYLVGIAGVGNGAVIFVMSSALSNIYNN
jgi:O-antigen ligase